MTSWTPVLQRKLVVCCFTSLLADATEEGGTQLERGPLLLEVLQQGHHCVKNVKVLSSGSALKYIGYAAEHTCNVAIVHALVH